MIQHLYNTHDVLEILPHWADYPLRPLNNINHTETAGIAEPPAVDVRKGAATKNFHQANEVYDIDQPLLRDLHHRLILHYLDAIGDQPNVLFSLSFQFVGPLKFQQFFMDTVAEWATAHKTKVKIALITTKDITDAILADPVRSKQVAMVDMRYWQYRPDGTVFAPEGGRNLAFRESVQKTFPGSSDHPPPTTAEMAYRQVREYRDRYPGLALAAWNNGLGEIPALMAGASMVLMNSPFGGHGQVPGQDRTRLDDIVDQHLTGVLMKMRPLDDFVSATEGHAWTIADQKLREVLIYSSAGDSVTLSELGGRRNYTGLWLDPSSLRTQPIPGTAAARTKLTKPSSAEWLLLLEAK